MKFAYYNCWQGSNPWRVISMAREKLKLNAAALQVPIGLEEHHRWVWAWSYEVLLGQRESRGCGGLLEDGHGGWYCELSLQAKELSQKGSFF